MATHREKRRNPLVVGFVVAALAVGIATAAAIGLTRSQPEPPPATATPTSASPTPSPSPTPEATTPKPTGASKLLVYVVENKSYSQVQRGAPWAYALATKYGIATDFRAIRHPSLPNYIAMATGSTQGVTNNDGPKSHKITAESVFSRAIDAGKTAKTYAETMPQNCYQKNHKKYAVRHNPWTYLVNERANCLKFDVPMGELATDLQSGKMPDVAFAIPDNCTNSHDCSLATFDAWFKAQMTDVFASPDWKSGALAVVLTADEDDKKSGNRILTALIHPSQEGRVVSTRLTLYSLTRLFAEFTHTEPLLNAATAPSMSEAFKLPIE